MIKHIWSVVCREAKVDAESNNVSIIDVLENIQIAMSVAKKDLEANKGKALLARFPLQVVSLFYRDTKAGEESFDYELRVLDAGGKMLGKFHNKIAFTEGLNRMRNITKFDTLALTESGTYIFQVLIRESNKLKQVSAMPVDIKLDIKKLND